MRFAVVIGILTTALATSVALAQAPAGVDPTAAAPEEEVVIIGTRTARAMKDSPVPIRVIDRREIEASGDATVADAVTRIAGVQVDTSLRSGQTPQIQGFASKHVLVLIDGRRITGRLADDFDLSRIPASLIERIEVLKGASSVLYGSDAIGGVINVVTRRPRPGLHSEVKLQHDSLKRDEASMAVSGGNDRVTARLDANHQTGPTFDLEPSDLATTGAAYERNNVQLEVRGTATEALELSVTAAGEEAINSGISLGAANAVIDLKTKGVGRSGKVGARFRPDAAGEVSLEVGESRRTYSLYDNQRGGDAADRRLDSKEISQDGSLIASRAYAGTHATTAGLDAAKQTYESNQLDAGERERERNSAFVQHEWRPLPALRLVPGVRYDVDSQFKDHTSKALALRFDPSETVILRASYGEGYRAPSFSELYFNFANVARGYRVEGNDELTPERSQSVQTAATWQPHADVWLNLGVFDSRVRDLIGTVRTQPAGILIVNYDNIDSVRNRGIEYSARTRLAQVFVLGVDYTFLDARDESRHRYLDGRAMHSGSVQARYDDRDTGVTVGLTVGLIGRRPYYTETPSGTVTDWSESYRAANLRIAKRFGVVELATGVRNLTNEGQEKYNPVPPRSYFGGIGADF